MLCFSYTYTSCWCIVKAAAAAVALKRIYIDRARPGPDEFCHAIPPTDHTYTYVRTYTSHITLASRDIRRRRGRQKKKNPDNLRVAAAEEDSRAARVPPPKRDADTRVSFPLKNRPNHHHHHHRLFFRVYLFYLCFCFPHDVTEGEINHTRRYLLITGVTRGGGQGTKFENISVTRRNQKTF